MENQWRTGTKIDAGTYIDQQVNFVLLRYNRIRATTQPTLRILQHIQLL